MRNKDDIIAIYFIENTHLDLTNQLLKIIITEIKIILQTSFHK